jgi:hypothetical protein
LNTMPSLSLRWLTIERIIAAEAAPAGSGYIGCL